MSVTISGDFAKLDEWRELFEEADELLAGMSQDMAEEILGLVQEGFSQERDPYGEAWKPKKRSNGKPTLVGKTARLRRGWHVANKSKGGFTIAPSVNYAMAHQSPKKRNEGWTMPRRMMVPSKERGLPASWKDSLGDVATSHLSAHFKRKGASKGAGIGFIAGKIRGIKMRFSPERLIKRVVREVVGD